MAEGFANHLGGGKVQAFSAGSMPLGRITPLTIEVMREKGITMEGHWSKGLDEVKAREMDVIVGMGCEVSCPVPAGFKGRVIEWNVPDPFGSDLDVFRRVRDLVERQVAALLEDIVDRKKPGDAE